MSYLKSTIAFLVLISFNVSYAQLFGGGIKSHRAGLISTLECGSATNNGLLFAGVNANSVTSVVPYTGGNGGVYSEQAVTSTGVTGLTATLSAGIFNNGSGSLTYTITGTPSSGGNAIFSLNIGGSTCALTIPVVPPFQLTCSSAIFSPSVYRLGVAYSGTLTIPYINGNGTSYSAQTITSTGNTNFTATLAAGTLAIGSGNLTLTVTGTSSSDTPAVFAITVSGSSCTITFTTCGAFVAAGVFKSFQCYNLGSYDTTVDPNVAVRAIHGNYYQWGRNAPAATVTATTDALVGPWGSQGGTSDDGRWTSTVGGGPGNPCPATYRVPSVAEWDGVIAFNARSITGPWNSSPANFTSALHYGPSTIFRTLTLPATGYRTVLVGDLVDRGSFGVYWSSTMATSTTAWYINFNSGSSSTTFNPRPHGFTVRCIRE